MESELAYTFPDRRGKCGLCGKGENGYAKRNPAGKWVAACWPCVRPTSSGLAQTKRKLVGTIYTE